MEYLIYCTILNLKLSEILKLDNYQVVTNVVQRSNRGGKSAVIVNTDKYYVKELCPDPITVPIGVEVVWAMLLPKYNRNNKHNINNIAVASIYSKPRSRKKKVLLDHIAETYNFLAAKYGDNLNFILAGDTNDLKLEPITLLSPNMKQVVTGFTRHNPDAMLDPIFTTLSKFYQQPDIKPPLDNDPDKNGRPSDHHIILMKPITSHQNAPARSPPCGQL